MNKCFKWYDLLLPIFLGPAIGGYCYIAVPCFTYDRPDMPCLVAGFIGSAAAFHNFIYIIKGNHPDSIEMRDWIIAATAAVFIFAIAKRVFDARESNEY